MSTPDGLNLHVLTASGRLEPHIRLLEQRIIAAYCDATAVIDLGDEPVDVVVRDAPTVTIPEIGIGGVAPDRHTIFISLDTAHSRFDHAIRSELARTIVHELHHVARRRAGCRGRTLWAAIVHEGLADHFSVELYGGDPPLWSLGLPEPALEALTLRAVAEGGDAPYDHGAWFYGTSPAVIPRWAGYAIGWRVVGEYLRRHPALSPSQLVSLPADAVSLG